MNSQFNTLLFLTKLKAKQISISLDDTLENLRIRGDLKNLSSDEKQEIIDNKFEITSFFKDNLSGIQTIEPVKTQPSYPISDAQRRLWVLSQFEGGSEAYNIPNSIHLNQDIDIENFRRAIDITIDRHEILRTVFREDASGEIRQWILQREALGFAIHYQDFRKETNKKEKAEAYIEADAYQLFDLRKGPLLRAALLQLGEKQYVFYFNMHHIISDGWSMEVLAKDVVKYYEVCQAGKESEIEELRIQYKDYSAWQLAQLNEESFKAHKRYWLDKLSGELPLLDFPRTKQRPGVKTYNGHGLATYVDKATTNKLKGYARENGGSLFMGLLASWNVLMYRYTSQTDIIIGTPLAGREHADLEDQIGFYVNTLALRNEVNPEESFDSFYSRVKENTLKSYSHQMYPFDRLIEELDVRRDTSRSAVFDVMLILQNIGERSEQVQLSEEALNQTAHLGHGRSKFDIEVTFQEKGDYLSLQITFNPDVYEKDMVEGLIRHYKQLLNALLETPEEKISQIDYLSEQERHNLLVAFNDTAVAYPKDKSIVDLFEAQAAKTLDNIAVVFEDRQLTYRELNERSNQLAHYLIERYDIQPDDLVGIKQARSEWMIVSILGVLKSGGAYVPIDPEYPQERINYIERDTNGKVCLDETELSKFQAIQESYSKEPVTSTAKEDNLAYVIYTSGSTGKPKGVMVEHRAIANTILSQIDAFKLTGKNTGLQFASFSFDASISETFIILLSGARLLIADESHRKDPDLLTSFITANEIDVATLSPSYLSKIEISALNGLKALITAGESAHYEKAIDYFEYGTYYNAYGPTETSICGTIFKLEHVEELLSNSIPIGKPIANTQIYILNEKEELQPVGVVGEICIGGNGLARGYLNQEKLTKEKFIASPFREGERLYKTGDLGRWLPDGNIEFIGRKDDQVKIRGHRIEPGEIERALLNHEGIDQAIVLAKENESGEKELVAFITSNAEQNTSDLRDYLKEQLPVYMLPAYFVQLEAMPLTANGKVDKKYLRGSEGIRLPSGREYVAPRNALEAKLVKIWEEILQRDNIGIADDFFVLGGHSIKAVVLSNEYQKELAVKLSLEDLFQHKTIASHAALIESSTRADFIQIERIAPQPNYALSDAQRRLWVVSQSEKASIAYNMPASIDLAGVFDIEILRKAIDATIDRHESLRTVFKKDESGEIKQWLLEREHLRFEVKYKDFGKGQNGYDKAAAFIGEDSFKPFDLENGPLLRASLLKVKEDKYIFYFNMHHIISDGWSLSVLAKDVLTCYGAFTEKREPALSPLKIQYKDYSAWQLAQLNQESFKEHKTFWLNKLSGELPLLDLPSVKPRPKIKTNNGRCLQAYINANVTGKLKKYSETNGGSLYMGLLAGWNILMYHYTNQKDIVIGSSIAGRNHADLQGQIGFYSNTLALRSRVEPEEAFETFFRSLVDATLKSFRHQMYPFIRLVEDLNFRNDPGRNPIFDVMLFLQNNGEKVNKHELKEEEINAISDKGYRPSKFDLNVALQEVNDCVSLDITFNPDVYEKDMVEGLMRHYQQLLNALLENPGKKIAQIAYLSHKERYDLLHFNDHEGIDYPKHKTVAQLFGEQVLRTPNNTALVFRNKKFTYDELDKLSNRLAHYLLENYQIEPGDLIGVMLGRSEWSIISILGILKAGGAYVPIDPEDPSSRKDFIINDASLKVLITEINFIHDIGHYDGVIFGIDVEFEPENYRADRLPVMSTPENLAYVIYTSGSSGKPKGAMITSRAVVDYSFGVLSKTNIRECESFGLVSTTSADLGNTVIYTSLLIGACLHVIAKEDIINADKMRTFNLDCIKMTPSHWKALQTEERVFTPNKCLILGGEPFSEEILRYVKQINNNCEVFNHYGPTETTIGKLIRRVERNRNGRVPLGRPFGDNKVYILNPNQQLCPIGVPGEICIGGVGLATGYLNQKSLTEVKFVNNPFVFGERLYKTGDVGKWLPNGEIEFIGRIDEQVKIRGYRIELEEIKLALLNLAAIEDAVVIVKENGNNEKELVAYIVAKSNQNKSDLRSMLRKSLPEYMIPASYVELESIPLTLNGKVDRDSLPDPKTMGIASDVEYIAPRNEMEEKITGIIADILGKPKREISVYDNFFDLGISSLGLMSLYVAINKEMGSNLQAVSVFEFSTVYALAEYLVNGSNSNATELKEENITAEIDDMIDLM